VTTTTSPAESSSPDESSSWAQALAHSSNSMSAPTNRVRG
jgi:hypothetical protein